MNSDLFRRATEQLDIIEVALWLGIELDRNSRARCPFHAERTASFFLSRSKRIYKCFGCGDGGDAIALTAKIKGIPPKEALKLLNERFGLGLDVDRPSNKKTLVEARREQEKHKLKTYQTWLESTHNRLCTVHRTLLKWRIEYAPKIEDEDTDKRFLLAVKYIPTVSAMLDDLAARDFYKITPSRDDLDITYTAKKLYEAISR